MEKGIYEEYGTAGVVFILALIICVVLLKLTTIPSFIISVVLGGIAWYFTRENK